MWCFSAKRNLGQERRRKRRERREKTREKTDSPSSRVR
jgi:hypothetical protein